MDPNATLRRLLDLIDTTLNDETVSPQENELAELVWSLDSWLTMGGFLPKRWDHPYRKPQPVEELT